MAILTVLCRQILTIEVTSILPKLHVNKCYNNLLCIVGGGGVLNYCHVPVINRGGMQLMTSDDNREYLIVKQLNNIYFKKIRWPKSYTMCLPDCQYTVFYGMMCNPMQKSSIIWHRNVSTIELGKSFVYLFRLFIRFVKHFYENIVY